MQEAWPFTIPLKFVKYASLLAQKSLQLYIIVFKPLPLKEINILKMHLCVYYTLETKSPKIIKLGLRKFICKRMELRYDILM